MSSLVEDEFENLLISLNIRFSRPERDASTPINLDFYLPDYDLYVEVKTFHTNRLVKQLEILPQDSNVLVLTGLNSVKAFRKLLVMEKTHAKPCIPSP